MCVRLYPHLHTRVRVVGEGGGVHKLFCFIPQMYHTVRCSEQLKKISLDFLKKIVTVTCSVMVWLCVCWEEISVVSDVLGDGQI